MKDSTKNKFELVWHAGWWLWAAVFITINPISWWTILAVFIIIAAGLGFSDCWKKL